MPLAWQHFHEEKKSFQKFFLCFLALSEVEYASCEAMNIAEQSLISNVELTFSFLTRVSDCVSPCVSELSCAGLMVCCLREDCHLENPNAASVNPLRKSHTSAGSCSAMLG